MSKIIKTRDLLKLLINGIIGNRDFETEENQDAEPLHY